ncbi:MAG: hypothetical protein PHG02_08255 [Oscillospiraceae bacterium]|nr:hypothetical protein [Oscillospiraceae bacterium]
MITIKPIMEQEIIDLINRGRFDGDVDGVCVTDGTTYMGNCLFKIENGIVLFLDTTIQDLALLDGAVRAAVDAGAREGTTGFDFNAECYQLTHYRSVFFESLSGVIENKKLLGGCCGCK